MAGLKLGEEIPHFTHPQHPLHHVFLPYQYTCNGCKEGGRGLRFRCGQCSGTDMHDLCARAPAVVQHPYHTQHVLIFYPTPPGGLIRSKCDMCGKAARGFAFRCPNCYFCLHPCCSKLPAELRFKGHPEHPLKLVADPPLPGASAYTCRSCGKKGSAWMYGCAACEFSVHVVCVKGVMRGLPEPDKSSKFGRAARFALQVVQVFMDGLVDSMGEAVGNLLVGSLIYDGRNWEAGSIVRFI